MTPDSHRIDPYSMPGKMVFVDFLEVVIDTEK